MAIDTLNEAETTAPEAEVHYWRFNLLQRMLHAFLIVSFLGLAASGMPLRFNEADWAVAFARSVGGFDAILFFHKFFAVVLTLVFAVHIGYVLYLAFVRKKKGMFWGDQSMVPRPKDVTDVIQHFRWFLGRGPRPQFSRFAYWEKFDYLAVFWGMFAIGATGYVMWFSETAARILPGWVFNVSLLVHSEEALLAAWFIFLIHFFNSHLRPEKFPMDDVIFTGRESLEELREGRPLEYQRIVERGRLETVRSDPPPRWLTNFGRMTGWTAMGIGFVLTAVTLLAFFTESSPHEEVELPDRPLVGPVTTTVPPEVTLTWDWDIGPMLEAECATCHTESTIAGYSVSTYEAALEGGQSGPAIVPGDATGSPIVDSQLSGIHFGMLDREQLADLTSWIDAGAPQS